MVFEFTENREQMINRIMLGYLSYMMRTKYRCCVLSRSNKHCSHLLNTLRQMIRTIGISYTNPNSNTFVFQNGSQISIISDTFYTRGIELNSILFDNVELKDIDRVTTQVRLEPMSIYICNGE